jgi:hypothetical protein
MKVIYDASAYFVDHLQRTDGSDATADASDSAGKSAFSAGNAALLAENGLFSLNAAPAATTGARRAPPNPAIYTQSGLVRFSLTIRERESILIRQGAWRNGT